MQNREQSPQFDFSSSFEQTLKEYEQTPEASQADFERAQEWRDSYENVVVMKSSQKSYA